MLKIIKSNVVFYFLAFCLGALLIAAINKYMSDYDTISNIQAQNKDVLNNVQIIEYEKHGSYLYVHLIGEKVRDDCGAPIKLSGYYGKPLVQFDIVELRKNLYSDDKIEFTEHPAIPDKSQDFGWWALYPDPKSEFYLYVDYLCGQTPDKSTVPYTKKEVLGPFSYGDEE